MTISEIAKMAGVSSACVSRYLNNGYVSEEKKSKIKQVIDQTGYVPSLQAQTLRTKRTKLIGVIIPKIDSEAISRVVAGISSEISGKGFQMLLANTENNPKKELEYIEILGQNRVDGIILIATEITKAHKTLLEKVSVPVVIVGQKAKFLPCIYHDDYGASYELAELLIKNNRKNIGFIGVSENDVAVGMERKQGFLDALKKNNVFLNQTNVVLGEFTLESGYACAKKILDTDQNIDALFCVTDTIALGVYKYIREHKKNIPSDISVVGFGHTKMSKVVYPPLTTVHFQYKTSGIQAAKIILENLGNNNIGSMELKLGYEIINNESI